MMRPGATCRKMCSLNTMQATVTHTHTVILAQAYFSYICIKQTHRNAYYHYINTIISCMISCVCLYKVTQALQILHGHNVHRQTSYI